MELREYVRILHKSWVLIVSITLLGIAAAAVVSLTTKPSYEAQTQLYVSVRSESQASGELVQRSNGSAHRRRGTRPKPSTPSSTSSYCTRRRRISSRPTATAIPAVRSAPIASPPPVTASSGFFPISFSSTN